MTVQLFHSHFMTIKQKILKALYPFIRAVSGLKNQSAINTPKVLTPAPVPFHSLRGTLTNGTPFEFSRLPGKWTLIVNTASDCGFTGQYADLQKLQEQFADRLAVLGFPANDFKEQEKGADSEIEQFCRKEFGVSFPLFKKGPVTGLEQQPVFQWLSDEKMNGWNNQSPTWNFCKYLVDPQGNLRYFLPSAVSPFDAQITGLLKQ